MNLEYARTDIKDDEKSESYNKKQYLIIIVYKSIIKRANTKNRSYFEFLTKFESRTIK